jgi:hypothetical protein
MAAPAQPQTSARSYRNGRATAAMILAIVGLPVAVVYPFGGIVLGLLGIALGANARLAAETQGFSNVRHSVVGMIIGTIDLILGIVIIAIVASSHS